MLRHTLLIAALAFAALSGAARAEEVTCGGVLGPASTEADLVKAYGRDNVVTGQVDGPEGSTLVATKVFPNDPAKAFEVYWWDEEALARIASFSVPAGATAPGGLRPGLTVKEVEALNGAPFSMSGFDWDYGGYADLTGGKLEQLPGGCYPSVRFEPTKEVPEGTNIDAVEGDVVVPSTEPLLDPLDVRVTEVTFGYADTESEEE